MTRENGGIASRQDLMRMTTEIVSAFTSRNSVPSSTLTTIIGQVHETLYMHWPNQTLKRTERGRQSEARGSHSSLRPPRLHCLPGGRAQIEDVEALPSRRLQHDPEEYRARWGLPQDYPMVAPNYAKKRSDFAKKMGLGKR